MSLTRLLGKLGLAAIVSLSMGLLFGLQNVQHREHPVFARSKPSVAQASTHFAIADFDGDLQPDMATIRIARDMAPAAEYFLELRLSSGLQPAIGILGPAGGLQVTPQDVNGDKIADLVITSPLDAHFVAIFLNDGKGNFHQVERSKYPDVGKRPGSLLLSPPDSTAFQLTLGQNRSTDESEARPGRWEQALVGSLQVLPASLICVQNCLMLEQSGRAPPLV